jgi:hypothetical protein
MPRIRQEALPGVSGLGMSLVHTNFKVINDSRHELCVSAATYHHHDYYATSPDRIAIVHALHPGESRFIPYRQTM